MNHPFRISKHAVFIFVAGALCVAGALWLEYDSYLAGRSMEGGLSLGGMCLLMGIACLGLLWITAAGFAVYRAVTRRGIQALMACTAILILCGVSYLVPMPSYMDGITEAFSANRSEVYTGAADWLQKRTGEKANQDVPAALFEAFPELNKVLKNGGKPRYRVEVAYTEVWTGGSISGHRGFRVYRENDDAPSNNEGSAYHSTYRKIHPRVYTFHRTF
jgi:hypothetical protein